MLRGKGCLRLQMELRLLVSWPGKREMLLDFQAVLNGLTRVSKGKEGGRIVSNGCNGRKVTGSRLALKIKGGHRPRNAGSLRSWKRHRNGSSPRGSRKGSGCDDPWNLAQEDKFQSSAVLNYKTMNLCGIKPLYLWLFVTAAKQVQVKIGMPTLQMRKLTCTNTNKMQSRNSSTEI